MNNFRTNHRPGRVQTAMPMLCALALAGAGLYSAKAYPDDKPFLSGKAPVTGDTLRRNRGAHDYKTANLNDVHGSVQNNTAVDVVSGHNTITNGAFSSVSGFPLVVQNSGANVVIQNSTIVNIGLQP